MLSRSRSNTGTAGAHSLIFALAAVALGPASPSTAQTSEPAAAGGRARSVRHTQAHADRVILSPSAETQPAGTVFASSYDIAVLQAGYAFSERLHASLTGLLTGQFFELNLKANLLRSRHVRLAVLSAIDYARADDDDDDDDDAAPRHLLFGRAGATLQLCFELRCRSSLSVSGTLVVHDQAEVILPLGLAAGLTAFVSDHVSLLLEYSGLFNAARDLEIVDLPVYLVAYGARVSGNDHWALDATLVRPLSSDDRIRPGGPGVFDFLGLPLLAFTYRFKV